MKTLIALLLLTGVFTLAQSASALTLISGGSADFSGSNATTYITFSNPLPTDKDTFAEWAVGDEISMGFDLSYSSTDDDAATGDNFTFGLNNSSNNQIYAFLTPANDQLTATPESSFYSRSGSRFMSTNGDALTGADTFSTAFMYDNPDDGDTENFRIDFSVLKASSNTYDLSLDIGANNFTDTVTINPADFEATEQITQFGLRVSNAALVDPAAANIDVTFTPVPEPSAAALLMLCGASLLLFRRRRA
jgi:hypothetical protein